MQITKSQLRRIIKEAMHEPEATARNFTLKGIQGLIRNAERELAELERADADYGADGREFRDEARQRIMNNLEQARAALQAKKG
jgi:hypothetical protein